MIKSNYIKFDQDGYLMIPNILLFQGTNLDIVHDIDIVRMIGHILV